MHTMPWIDTDSLHGKKYGIYCMDEFFKSVVNDYTTQVNDINTPFNVFFNGYMMTENESPCARCPNNPAVNKFASGVCHCVLATQSQIIY